MVKLTIIIPYYETYLLTYNLAQTLLPQLTDEVEIILIDDGCNEKRLDQFKNDNFHIIHSEENKGGAFTCNLGISMAKGKYIGFIDCDDMVSDEYIETLLKTINVHNEDVIYMNWKDINTGEIVKHPENYAYWKAIYKSDMIPRFTENTKCNFDVPFYDDLLKLDYTKYYIDKVLYFYNSFRVGSITWKQKEERRKNMIKLEVIEDFTLKDFYKLVNIKRIGADQEGKLFVGDTFECDEEMAKYLLGDNPLHRPVVNISEIQPEKKVEKEPKVNEIVSEASTKELKAKSKKKKSSKK